MNRDARHDRTAPTPAQLAAYADGELGPADRAAVEAWLREYPEGHAQVEAQRGPTELCRHAAPPEPDEAAWAATLARVEAGLVGGRQRRPWRLAAWLAVGGTAAAAVLAFLLGRSPPQAPQAPPIARVLPVVAPDDVDIISMDGRDRDALVVGDPPVRGSLTLASAQDVSLNEAGRDVEMLIPEGNMPDQAAPMLVPAGPAAGTAP
jgi:hypothetical protein